MLDLVPNEYGKLGINSHRNTYALYYLRLQCGERSYEYGPRTTERPGSRVGLTERTYGI